MATTNGGFAPSFDVALWVLRGRGLIVARAL
jgi:hypothetical protein